MIAGLINYGLYLYDTSAVFRVLHHCVFALYSISAAGSAYLHASPQIPKTGELYMLYIRRA